MENTFSLKIFPDACRLRRSLAMMEIKVQSGEVKKFQLVFNNRRLMHREIFLNHFTGIIRLTRINRKIDGLLSKVFSLDKVELSVALLFVEETLNRVCIKTSMKLLLPSSYVVDVAAVFIANKV